MTATEAHRPSCNHCRLCGPSDLADATSPRVVDALTRRCDICKAAVGDLCTNTIRPGVPLPGRLVHLGRLQKP